MILHQSVMNIIRKGNLGSINEIKKRFRKKRTEETLQFEVARMDRDVLKRLLVVSGRVGDAYYLDGFPACN